MSIIIFVVKYTKTIPYFQNISPNMKYTTYMKTIETQIPTMKYTVTYFKNKIKKHIPYLQKQTIPKMKYTAMYIKNKTLPYIKKIETHFVKDARKYLNQTNMLMYIRNIIV